MPLPVLYDTRNDEAVVSSPQLTDHIAQLVRAQGMDVWWTASIEELMPESLIPDGVKREDLRFGLFLLEK